MIDDVVQTFVTELKRQLGTGLEAVWLFGSRARGEARDGSDHDMLVIADGETGTLKNLVREAEWICMERYNALVASIVYSPVQWQQRKHSPLGWNIQKEGKLVA